MTPKSNNGGPHENACKPKSTATTAHAEAPACPRPEPTLALASSLAFSTSCLAFSTSCLAFSTFFSASLTSCLSTLASSLRPALSSSSHNAVRVLTACCAVSSSLMATFCTCRAAARSCQVQGCFLVLLPPCHSLQWSRSGSTHQQHARRPSWHLRPSLWSAQRQPAPRHPAEQLSMQNPKHTEWTNKPGLIFVVLTFRRLRSLRCPGNDTHSAPQSAIANFK